MLITSLSLFSFMDFEIDEGWSVPHADKIMHFIFYFVFVVLALLSLKQRKNSLPLTTKTLFVTFIVAVIYGVLIEFMQNIMPFDRIGDFWDVLANTVGALFGTLLTKSYLSLNGVSK